MNINKNRVLVFILIFIVTMFLISGIKCVNAASGDIERVNSISSDGYIKTITGNKISSNPSYKASDTWINPDNAPTDYLLKYYVRKIYEIDNDKLIKQELPTVIKPGTRIGSVGGTNGTFNYNATVQSDNAPAWRVLLVQNDML